MTNQDDAEGGAPTTRKLFDGSGAAALEMRLVVLNGEAAGRTVVCRDAPLSIGTVPDNGLVLTDSSISRRHAEIRPEAGGFVLHDLASTNGTFVNEVGVREGVLPPAGVLRLGTTTIRFERGVSRIDVPASSAARFGKLVGRSLPMRRLFTVLERAAPTDTTILVTGPSGTGKELVAEAIHEASRRKKGPFVVLDCGAIDPGLISSELFGHEAGAFTGAASRRAGVFEQAHGGTVFLDEIGELPLDLQPKLLRVLESRTLRRLGGNATINVDMRVVSATNRDLEQLIAAGKFREDLYYRLSQLQLRLPPLDSRREDVPLLVEAILERMASSQPAKRMSSEAMAQLWLASLPGNVRQLRNIVERAAMIATGELIEVADLMLSEERPPSQPITPSTVSSLPDDDRRPILEALAANGQVLTRAAQALGIAVNTLKARMKRLGIPLPQRPGMPGPPAASRRTDEED